VTLNWKERVDRGLLDATLITRGLKETARKKKRKPELVSQANEERDRVEEAPGVL